MTAAKFAELGIVEGLAVPFGSPARRDRDGQYFTSATDFGLDWFDERPLLLHHGLGSAGPVVVGRVRSATPRSDGVWIEATLDKASRWFGQIRDQLQEGILGFSSATMAHLAQITAGGEITRWPLVEVSLTRTPASDDARIYSVRSADAFQHYDAAGLPSASLKALMTPPAPIVVPRQETENARRARIAWQLQPLSPAISRRKSVLGSIERCLDAGSSTDPRTLNPLSDSVKFADAAFKALKVDRWRFAEKMDPDVLAIADEKIAELDRLESRLAGELGR